MTRGFQHFEARVDADGIAVGTLAGDVDATLLSEALARMSTMSVEEHPMRLWDLRDASVAVTRAQVRDIAARYRGAIQQEPRLRIAYVVESAHVGLLARIIALELDADISMFYELDAARAWLLDCEHEQFVERGYEFSARFVDGYVRYRLEGNIDFDAAMNASVMASASRWEEENSRLWDLRNVTGIELTSEDLELLHVWNGESAREGRRVAILANSAEVTGIMRLIFRASEEGTTMRVFEGDQEEAVLWLQSTED